MFYWSISTHWINTFPMKFICLNLFYGLGHSFKLYIRFVYSLRQSFGVKIETEENRKRESNACDYQQHPLQQIVFCSLFLCLSLAKRMSIWYVQMPAKHFYLMVVSSANRALQHFRRFIDLMIRYLWSIMTMRSKCVSNIFAILIRLSGEMCIAHSFATHPVL